MKYSCLYVGGLLVWLLVCCYLCHRAEMCWCVGAVGSSCWWRSPSNAVHLITEWFIPPLPPHVSRPPPPPPLNPQSPPDRPPPLSAPPLSTGSLMQMRIWYIHVYLDQWHKLGVSTEGRRGLGMANIKKTINNIIYLFIRIWIWIRITFITSCCTSTQRLKWSGLVP